MLSYEEKTGIIRSTVDACNPSFSRIIIAKYNQSAAILESIFEKSLIMVLLKNLYKCGHINVVSKPQNCCEQIEITNEATNMFLIEGC